MADPRLAGHKPDSPLGADCLPRRSELVASLAAFDSPTAIKAAALSGLVAKGWIEQSAGWLRLTPDGEQEHAELVPLVDDVRGRVAAALP